MLFLKQSTASQAVLIGPFIDDTDGATPETGLTIANTDIRLSKAGGNLAAKASGGGTHDEAGWYTITLDATDTNTVGTLQLHVKVAGALMVHNEFQIVEEDTFTWFFASGAAPDTQVAAIKTVVDGIQTDLDNGADGLGAIKAETALIVADTAELQTDNIPGLIAALDIVVDRVEADTINIQGRLPAALVNSRMDSTIDAIGLEQGALDNIWDEPLTGASHNDPTSAGKRLRQTEEAFVHASGTVAAIGIGALSSREITLDGGAVATAGYYVGDRLQITEGAGAGQSRIIIKYTGTKVCTLDSDFIVDCDTSSLYDVVAADVHIAVSDADLAEGYIASVTNGSVFVLDATTAVATTDYYVGDLIVFTHGTGIGQSREIVAYTAGRSVTVAPAFTTTPDTTTAFHIVAMLSAAEVADEVLNEALSGHTTAGSLGKAIADIEADTNELQVDNTPGALSAIDGKIDTIDTAVTAIKVPTDKMVFTKANELDANTKSINDAEVVGDGNATPWDGI